MSLSVSEVLKLFKKLTVYYRNLKYTPDRFLNGTKNNNFLLSFQQKPTWKSLRNMSTHPRMNEP